MATATPKITGQAKFGLLFHPTPDTAKTIARVILYGAAIITGLINIFTDVPDHFKLAVVKYSSQVVAAVYLVCHMWGIEPVGPKTDVQDSSTVK